MSTRGKAQHGGMAVKPADLTTRITSHSDHQLGFGMGKHGPELVVTTLAGVAEMPNGQLVQMLHLDTYPIVDPARFRLDFMAAFGAGLQAEPFEATAEQVAESDAAPDEGDLENDAARGSENG